MAIPRTELYVQSDLSPLNLYDHFSLELSRSQPEKKKKKK